MLTPARTFTWRKSVPQELAQFALPELPAELRWPPYVSRLDLLATKGRSGVVRQLYEQLLELGLTYELAPFTPLAGETQTIRGPGEILASRAATCIDLALLMAGMCLAADLLPLLVVLDGHALLAVALNYGRAEAGELPGALAFEQGLLTSLEQLRAWADDEAFLLVECTGAAASRRGLSPDMPEGRGRDRRGYFSFDDACAVGIEQIGAEHAMARGTTPGRSQRVFLYAVNVPELQQRGFPPLTGEVQGQSGTTISQHGKTNIGQVGTIGTFVAGDSMGGDKVGGDKVGGDKFTGDKVMGDKVVRRGGLDFGRGNQFGDISFGDIAGRDIVKATINLGEAPARPGPFAAAYAAAEAANLSGVLRPLVSSQLAQLEVEASRGPRADRDVIAPLLNALSAMAPAVGGEARAALRRMGIEA